MPANKLAGLFVVAAIAVSPGYATADTAQENGVAVVVAKRIKGSMNDPRSFELNTLIVFPGGSACYEYRGKNAFNATIKQQAVFDVAAVKVISNTERGFAKAWNRICTKPNGRDITAAARMYGGL